MLHPREFTQAQRGARHGDDLVRVYLAKLEELCNTFPLPLAPEERERLDSIRHERRRRSFIAGRVLARRAVEHCTGVPAEHQRFRTLPSGRPVSVDGPAISISHSGDSVACVVALRGDVGLDLQFPAAHVRANEIAEWCFAADEREWIAASPRTERFFMLWALKEAHLKATGGALFGGGLGRMSCRVSSSAIEARFHSGPETHMALYAYADGFLALAMSEASGRPVEIVGADGGEPAQEIRFIAETSLPDSC